MYFVFDQFTILGHAGRWIHGNGSRELLVLRFAVNNSVIDPWIYILLRKQKHSWLSRNTAEVSAKAYLTKLILQRNLAALNLIQIKIAAVEVWTRPCLPTTSFPPMLCRNAESIQSVLQKYLRCQLCNLMWVDWMCKPMLGMIMYVNQCFVNVLTLCYFFIFYRKQSIVKRISLVKLLFQICLFCQVGKLLLFLLWNKVYFLFSQIRRKVFVCMDIFVFVVLE